MLQVPLLALHPFSLTKVIIRISLFTRNMTWPLLEHATLLLTWMNYIKNSALLWLKHKNITRSLLIRMDFQHQTVRLDKWLWSKLSIFVLLNLHRSLAQKTMVHSRSLLSLVQFHSPWSYLWDCVKFIQSFIPPHSNLSLWTPFQTVLRILCLPLKLTAMSNTLLKPFWTPRSTATRLVCFNVLSSGKAMTESLKKHHGLMWAYAKTLRTSLKSSTSIILTSQDLWPSSESLNFLWFSSVFLFFSSARLLSLYFAFQFTFPTHSVSFLNSFYTLRTILHF